MISGSFRFSLDIATLLPKSASPIIATATTAQRRRRSAALNSPRRIVRD